MTTRSYYFYGDSLFDKRVTNYLLLALNPSAVWAEGPGIEPEGVVVRHKAIFTVHTENAGDGKLGVKIIGPRKCKNNLFQFVKQGI